MDRRAFFSKLGRLSGVAVIGSTLHPSVPDGTPSAIIVPSGITTPNDEPCVTIPVRMITSCSYERGLIDVTQISDQYRQYMPSDNGSIRLEIVCSDIAMTTIINQIHLFK